MSGSERDWLLEIRRRGGGSRRIRLGSRSLLLALLGAAFALLLVGVAAGRIWQGARQDRRVADLQARLAGLEGERERLEALAARLESIESSYGRIRRALGGEVAPSARDVVLPPLIAPSRREPSGGEELGRAEAPWAWPLAQAGFVTRAFGSPLASAPDGHPGLDIAVPVGSYVRSTGAGIVAEAGRDSVYGFFVRIAHREGLSSLYAHNSWVFVAPGDTVERLQVIAVSGNTGRSTAPHLHFEIGRNGVSVDPLSYLGVGG